jgi:hypothetical protein
VNGIDFKYTMDNQFTGYLYSKKTVNMEQDVKDIIWPVEIQNKPVVPLLKHFSSMENLMTYAV